MQIWPGQPYPLGATFDGVGTNFSIFSEAAQRVELCLFDEAGAETRVDLPEVTALCWHVYLPEVRPGQRYGYRVHGPWAPEQGLWCNPNKLLMDPYAKAIEGMWDWNEAVFPYHFKEPENSKNDLDSARFCPRSVVVISYLDKANDRRPNTPWHKTVVYETHVKGFTKRHPGIPEELRGTYSGMAHPVAIKYLQRLGVTAVELLPVHQFVQDSTLIQKGLRNYWGYNSIGYMAPHNEYARGNCGDQVQEFKHLVKTMHEAGIEVILDVVYNHTAEGNHLGPMLSFKGIDNAAYYRVVGDRRRYYMDYTGTGNTLNMRHPHVLQLIMDSLRYWVLDMHVDGFRFDLAATLARQFHEVDKLSAFFDIIQQDPVISQVKLIAEPWDLGDGGYQVGNFPPLWTEWNGKYRDTVRDFWRGEPASLAEFASRITGSSDLYEHSDRRPTASINFVVAHDGFTLRDLVSYNYKHNQANGEGGNDGESHNRSWNCGVEGETDDPAINALRLRQQRNFITTMMVSQGVPMLAHGDELGRTQRGNNNVYAQDNEISWVNWDLNADQKDLQAFTSAAISLRKTHPVLRRRRFFAGDAKHGGKSELGDILWFKPDASEMDEADWNSGFARSVMVFLNGDAIPELDAVGRPITDDHFLLLFNAHIEPIRFTLPVAEFGQNWLVRLNTATGQVDPPEVRPWRAKTTHRVEAHAMVVLSTTVVPEAERQASQSRALRATASAAKAPMRP